MEDITGHGTSIAGIIGAKDNGKGITGINPDAKLYSVKILDDIIVILGNLLDNAIEASCKWKEKYSGEVKYEYKDNEYQVSAIMYIGQ